MVHRVEKRISRSQCWLEMKCLMLEMPKQFLLLWFLSTCCIFSCMENGQHEVVVRTGFEMSQEEERGGSSFTCTVG